jgi:pyruvate,water dikinase
MFSLDTESGFDKVVLITAAYGLGELLVQGAVDPDEYFVHKENIIANRPAILSRRLGQKQLKMIYAPSNDQKRVLTESVPEEQRKIFCLKEEEIEQLASYALTIEKHYGRPMDIEWAKDGEDQALYIVQARPETVKSQEKAKQQLIRYELESHSKILCEGRAIGQRIGSGLVKVVRDLSEMDRIKKGDILVTDMTDPDWEPIMKRAAAIVTNRGGRTCHAAIIARELGIPAVVGTGTATELLKEGQAVTVSCSEGEVGNIYEGILPFRIREISLEAMPKLAMKIMMNVGNPERSFDFQRLPNQGVGLARMEFVISRLIGIHPNACLNIEKESQEIQERIRAQSIGYENPVCFYVQKLIEGMATLAAAFSPNPVIIRFSDFKSNEYANLIGGRRYEPTEENPMLGFRGASRYLSISFKEAFALECEAISFVREQMGFTNIAVMVPFVRTVSEAKAVLDLMASHGLKRGEKGLRVMMMCELPTNCLLASQYLEHFDGFSIGSNDLTQLTLGLDRDSGLVAKQFDERDPAVKILLKMAIDACHAAGKYVGICGEGPSDHPDLAKWLMEAGIDSVSLNPDSVLETWLSLAK